MTDYDILIRSALESQKYSYAPYSKFNVSAAVRASSGKIYTGVNIENSSYPAGICAERSAISCAVSHGEREITAIAIVGGADCTVTDYCPPCGICRQVMREFCNPKEFVIILAKSEDDYRLFTLYELLPNSFGPEILK